jgi:hypothetical protein
VRRGLGPDPNDYEPDEETLEELRLQDAANEATWGDDWNLIVDSAADRYSLHGLVLDSPGLRHGPTRYAPGAGARLTSPDVLLAEHPVHVLGPSYILCRFSFLPG